MKFMSGNAVSIFAIFAGVNYTDWRQVRWAFEKTINYRNRERVKRGRRFRDTQDERRKHRKPLWKRR